MARDVGMKTLLRAACLTLAMLAAATLLAPGAFYVVGLQGVVGRPSRPPVVVSAEAQRWVWQQVRGAGRPHVEPMNPYTLALSISGVSGTRSSPGELVVWTVAADYLSQHRAFRGMGWWHLSGAALSIWISRAWSTEEILSAAADVFQKKGLTPPSGGQPSAAAPVTP